MNNVLPRLLLILIIVSLSVSSQAFEIDNLGADFSVENQFEAKIYFENKGNQVISIQQNNDFGYFNRFTQLTENSYKWDLVFDRTGRADVDKIVIIFPDTTVTGNTVTINKFVIGFRDAIEQGFDVEVKQLGNDSQVVISGFSVLLGIVMIDPTIIDSSALSKTNYGNTMVRDSSGNIFVVHEEVVTSANTDIFVSKSTNNGNSFTTFNLTDSSDVNETLPHLDINSTDGLILSFDGNNGVDAFVTTCSSGGCDSNSEFLAKVNVSSCGATQCSNSNIITDVNGNSHMVYTKGGTGVFYRTISGFVGGSWGTEETAIAGGDIIGRDGIGILIANNGSNRKLAFANTDNSQVRLGYFNTLQWTEVQLETNAVEEPATGFAGYDGNFYLVYSKAASNAAGVGKQMHFRQCVVTADCNVLANWSVDVNITEPGLNMEFVTSFQSADLNFNVLASSVSDAADANIFNFVRTPNNVWVTSSLADGNLMVSDSNRTFNPLYRSRAYDGSVLPRGSLPTTGNLELDFVYFTSNNSTGDPSTLIFDSNISILGNAITASFTTTPTSPISLDPENGINNVQVDLNSTSSFFGPIVDINYNWQIDSNAIGISTDVNLVWDFNGGNRDINVSLIVQGNDGTDTFTSQNDQNVLLRLNAQGLDINFVFTATDPLADINYGVTDGGSTALINYAVWGFPNDQNLLGLQVAQQYRVGDVREVCVVVNTTGDVNKLRCENFFNTHLILKIPKDISNLDSLTPFTATVDSVPTQARTDVSVDQNFWFFYQTNPDSNTLNLIVDANLSFFLSNYLVGLNAVDLNQTIQPYMVGVTTGVNVIFTAKDSLTNDSVPGTVIAFSRNVSTDGDVEVQSGVTDSLGRITLPFETGIDHNFTMQFPFGTIIKTGTYIPQTIDATNGVILSIPSAVTGDFNTFGRTDINFLQSQVDPASPVDINVIIESTSDMNSITVTIDHNGVQQAIDTNSFMVNSFAQFNFNVETDGLSSTFPFIVTVDINYNNGATFQTTKAVTISRTQFDLFESFTTARDNDLGNIGGTMILSAFVIALILGILHFTIPSVENSQTFVIAATILLFLSFVGWVDGVTWVLASIAGGAVYFLRRVDR